MRPLPTASTWSLSACRRTSATRAGHADDVAHDYWVISLPAGEKVRGKSIEERMTDDLTELAERGWEPVSFDRSSPIGPATFLLRKARA